MEGLEMLPWACKDERSTKDVSGDLCAFQIIIFGYSLWVEYAV